MHSSLPIDNMFTDTMPPDVVVDRISGSDIETPIVGTTH